MNARLFQDPPAEGPWNMALDEATLEQVVREPDALPTLRWYRWSRPTLSLGYFQSSADVPSDLADLPRVRRLTGGGAILHDRELTYSLVFPPHAWPKENFLDLVHDMHDVVREIAVGLAFAGPQKDEARPDPFLCFERRSPLDLVQGSGKVVGSAQRKRAGALLQHGSILLSASPRRSELVGRAEVDWESAIPKLVNESTQSLAARWDWTFLPSTRQPQEVERAHELTQTKYSAASWNDRR